MKPIQETSLLTVSEHLQELRKRLFWIVLSLFLGGGIGYIQRTYILEWLIAPLNEPLYYSSPIGGLDFIFRVCLFLGIILATPVITYNLLRYLEPILVKSVKHMIIKIALISSLLSIGGTAFAYYISLPAALKFLSNFGGESVNALIQANQYLSFVMTYLAGFALLFQLPLILLFINKITPLPPGRLLKHQRIVIILSFIVAAIITPTPDPFNQILMAGPIIVLYQVSIFLIWINNIGNKHNAEEETKNIKNLETTLPKIPRAKTISAKTSQYTSLTPLTIDLTKKSIQKKQQFHTNVLDLSPKN